MSAVMVLGVTAGAAAADAGVVGAAGEGSAHARLAALSGAAGFFTGGYTSSAVPADAVTRTTFTVWPMTDERCTSDADQLTTVSRSTASFTVDVWISTSCSRGTVSRQARLSFDFGGEDLRKPVRAGDELTFTVGPKDGGTELRLRNETRGWAVVRQDPSPPGEALWAEVVGSVPDGQRGPLGRQAFSDITVDGEPFGDFEPERFENECARVGRLVGGVDFTVRHTC